MIKKCHFCLFFFTIHLTNMMPIFGSHESQLSCNPIHEVESLGAATTGSLIEGVVGSTRKGPRHRFSCQSSGPKPGFLGPQMIAKPSSVKDQPGIFPAPLVGSASLSFTFTCNCYETLVTPVIVKPDGTTFVGQPMNAEDLYQTLMIPSPAQTGIYTLFILAHGKEQNAIHASVSVKASTDHQTHTFQLKPFDPKDKKSELTSAEFIYRGTPNL